MVEALFSGRFQFSRLLLLVLFVKVIFEDLLVPFLESLDLDPITIDVLDTMKLP